jgi:hypothetical protein
MAHPFAHIVLNHYEPEESAAAGEPLFSTIVCGREFLVMDLGAFARRFGFDAAEVRRILRDRRASLRLVAPGRRPSASL